MIDIIPYGDNPYVIPMIPLCGNHGFSFCCLVYGYVFLFTISFLSYRGEPIRMYIRNENVNTYKNY